MNGRCKEVASKIELQRRLAELNRLLRQLNKLEELVRDVRDTGIATFEDGEVKVIGDEPGNTDNDPD